MSTTLSPIKPNEVRFAYWLLSYLHANSRNSYLLLAIIAWVRAASGSASGRYAGNNPLKMLVAGRVAAFSTLQAAARAIAKRLLTSSDYRLVRTVVQRDEASEKEQATQAMDFLQAVAMSKWDRNHYDAGSFIKTLNPEAPYKFIFDNSKNALIAVWSKMLGKKFTIPADVLPQPKPPAPPKPAPQPRQADRRIPTVQQNEYIQPYAAREFLEARWQPLVPLGDA
jgi:hypothetical protein